MSEFSLRPARAEETAILSELALRSKGHWGYDAAFLEACRDELRITVREIEADDVAVVDRPEGVAAYAHVRVEGVVAELVALFVDPPSMGLGLGRRLWEWACSVAQARGATVIRLDADPFAEDFYLRMGASTVGRTPSGSIPGRTLPLMERSL